MNITTDELLDALRAALGPAADGEGQTVQELVEKTGWGEWSIRKHLGRLAKEGRIEVVRVKRTRLDGVSGSCPAYRMKP